jgi:hypothetical protein
MTAELKGLKGYPEGFAEPRYAYRERLRAPYHERSLRRAGAQPGAQAVVLSGEWQLAVPADASPQLRAAAADFLRFMEACMETPLRMVEIGAGAGEQPKSICLKVAPAELPVPESYVLEIGPEAVVVRGADASGVQYGLYELEEAMERAGGPFVEPGRISRQPWAETRILRSFFSPFYHNELLDEEDYYPGEYLNRLAHHRVNGVWLHLKLRDVVPSAVFPEFGSEAAASLPRLRQLVERAGKYGIKVYIYFNEPRNFARRDPFWEKYPHLRGAPSGSFQDDESATYAMCTSQPEVLEFLEDSCRRLFAEVPGLGGVFLITASEHHTHCFSHVRVVGRKPPYDEVQCPRCRERRPSEVVVEVVRAIAKGIHSVAPEAKVMVWNWSWETLYGREGQEEIIAGLPPDTILMPDFERGDQKTVLGKFLPIDEYALSFIGPSQRFEHARELGQRRGLPVYAKFQFVNTHELANIPYLPLPGVVYEKFARLRKVGGKGLLGCWIFGNYPCLITDLAGQLYFEPFAADRYAVLRGLAEKYFGAEAATDVLEAWDWFARAWDLYPFYVPLLYYGPHVQGPAFPWFLEPIHKPAPPNWRDRQPPGDNLLHLIPDQDVLWFDKVMGELLRNWANGLQALERAFEKIPAPRREQYWDYGVARCVYHQMTSLRNTVRFYVERELLLRSQDRQLRRAILARLRDHILAEIANAEACLPYVEADSRLGWHSECFDYQFTPETITARVAELRKMAEETIPRWLETDSGLVEPQPYSEPLSDAPYERLLQHLAGVDLRQGIFR